MIVLPTLRNRGQCVGVVQVERWSALALTAEDGLACKILYILVTPVTVCGNGHLYSHTTIKQS